MPHRPITTISWQEADEARQALIERKLFDLADVFSDAIFIARALGDETTAHITIEGGNQ